MNRLSVAAFSPEVFTNSGHRTESETEKQRNGGGLNQAKVKKKKIEDEITPRKRLNYQGG